MQNFSRRTIVTAGISAITIGATLTPVLSWAGPRNHGTKIQKDFDSLWRTLRDQYCFFAEKQTDWDKVRALYRPMAAQAASVEEFTEVVRLVLAELYDAHTHLSPPPVGSPRWPLFDLLVHRREESLEIAAIDEGSAAALAGLSIGDKVVAINGQRITETLDQLRPRCLLRLHEEAEDYSANVAVAGRRGQARQFAIMSKDAKQRTVDLPIYQRVQRPDVEWRRLDNGAGYIVIGSFSDDKVVESFDLALAELRDASGLIIDVQQNGGGDTAVARPIMGRFITSRKPYAMMRRRKGAGLGSPWIEYVDPRGPFTYERPVVVLTGHWSASMAEGFPMGMRGIGRATVVGTRMMGLGAAVFTKTLKQTGVTFQFSAEPVYDVQNLPRWQMEPDIAVRAGDNILTVAVSELSDKYTPRAKT
ncbi:MAG: S41 family peptidase [Sphingorhabdus sp.]